MFDPICVSPCFRVSDDVDLNNVASIPGMGIPEQLKAAMEQEQSSKSDPGTGFPDSGSLLSNYYKCGRLSCVTLS